MSAIPPPAGAECGPEEKIIHAARRRQFALDSAFFLSSAFFFFLATDASLAARLYTAALNLLLGIAIGSLVAGVARTSTIQVTPGAAPRPYPGTYG